MTTSKVQIKTFSIVAFLSLLIFIIVTSCEKEESINYITDIEGNEYTTITIGTQEWFKENLKTSKFNDGTEIPLIMDNTWAGLSTSAYCWYDNDSDNKNLYGNLYNWHAVETGKLCPDGWHVPSEEEWSTLIDFLGGSDIAGGKMKSINEWNIPNEGATNESGFSALPGGDRDGVNAGFSGLGSSGYWWSSTAEDNIHGIGFKLKYNNAGIDGFGGGNNKSRGMSIRCIKD